MKKAFVMLMAIAAGMPGIVWPATYYVNNTVASANDAGDGSMATPMLTISAGLKKAVAGDTVLVLKGSYMENVVFAKSGTPGNPIVLKADPSKTVCIHGTDTIKNFSKATLETARENPNYSSIYWAELPKTRSWENWDASLLDILVEQDIQPLKMARWPSSAWFPYGDLYTNSCPAQSGDSFSIGDKTRLAFAKGAIVGAIVVLIDNSTGKTPIYRTVSSYDSVSRRLSVSRSFGTAVEPNQDLYYMENSVSFIHHPGEFAIDTFVKPDRLYLWPLDNKDPNACAITVLKNGSAQMITWAPGVSYIVIDGFYVSDAGSRLGIGSSYPGSHIEIKNCVLARASMFLVNQSYVTIMHCVQTGAPENGIDISTCNNIDFVENEVYDNGSDGVTVSHDSRNVNVLRNYIHDQWSFTHPDGIQIYRNVHNITIDSNLIYNCGQGIMTQEFDTGRIINNMIVGTHGAGILLGYGSAKNIEVRNNTIFFTGMGPFATDAPNNTFVNNLVGYDYSLARYGWKNATNLTEDYNLFIRGPGAVSAADTAGMGPHSKRSSNIIFNNGVVGRAYMVTVNNVAGSSPSTLKFDATGNFFSKGDFIEANFDDSIRKVTAATATTVSFTPPLYKVHPDGWDLLMNWKSSTSYKLDLRLAKSSDGFSSGIGGTTIGSSIDIQAYRNRDLNGDGKRDLPVLPASLYKTSYYVNVSVNNERASAAKREMVVISKNKLIVFRSAGDQDFSLKIFQLNGTLVSSPIQRSNAKDKIVIDLHRLAGGVYLAVLNQKGKALYSQPIVIR